MRHERMGKGKSANASSVYVTLVVRDYDEAIQYYTNALGFELVEDTALDDEKRWVLLAARRGSVEPRSLLAKASTPQQAKRNR